MFKSLTNVRRPLVSLRSTFQSYFPKRESHFPHIPTGSPPMCAAGGHPLPPPCRENREYVSHSPRTVAYRELARGDSELSHRSCIAARLIGRDGLFRRLGGTGRPAAQLWRQPCDSRRQSLGGYIDGLSPCQSGGPLGWARHKDIMFRFRHEVLLQQGRAFRFLPANASRSPNGIYSIPSPPTREADMMPLEAHAPAA